MTEYSSKADIYHKYRWDYHIDAINFIISSASIHKDSVILDLGAGTGMLTKHFANLVEKVYAVEPDSNMLHILKKTLKDVISIQRYSHYIPEIPDNSVNVIIVAHALHWFDFKKTLIELNRISTTNCLLFSIENRNISEDDLFIETGRIIEKYKNTSIKNKHDIENLKHYFKDNEITEVFFDYMININFDTFIGSLASTSFLPSPSDFSFSDFRNDSEKLFLKYVRDGEVETKIRTTVKYGYLTPLLPNFV